MIDPNHADLISKDWHLRSLRCLPTRQWTIFHGDDMGHAYDTVPVQQLTAFETALCRVNWWRNNLDSGMQKLLQGDHGEEVLAYLRACEQELAEYGIEVVP